MDKLEKQLEIAKKKRDGMKSIKANPASEDIPSNASPSEARVLQAMLDKLNTTRKEYDKILAKANSAENAGRLEESDELAREADRLQARIEKLSRQYESSRDHVANKKSTLVSDLITAEDNGDELEAAIIRAKIRKANASNADSREALAIKRSVRATVRPGETSGPSDERELQLYQEQIDELQKAMSENRDEISRLQSENTDLNKTIIALERRISTLKNK